MRFLTFIQRLLGAGPDKKCRLRVQLLTTFGMPCGHHTTLGRNTPVVLFKGDETYIRQRPGVMKRIGPRESILQGLTAQVRDVCVE